MFDSPLILQPLIENAVNHGIAPLPAGGTIVLLGKISGESMALTVENPVDPDYVPSKKGGLGMENVRKRLAVIHGSLAKLRTKPSTGTFVAEISAPVERAND